MNAPLLLDTCAAIWAVEDAPMSTAAISALDETWRDRRAVYVSPITAWEIGMLIAKGKLRATITPQEWFRRLLDVSNVQLAEMSPDVLISSSFLPGTPPRDPADRIIAATARTYGYVLVTRDRLLLDYGAEGYARVLEC